MAKVSYKQPNKLRRGLTIRKFDEKSYLYYMWDSSKSDAKKRAKELREKGCAVRVAKIQDGGWGIFTRKGRK